MPTKSVLALVNYWNFSGNDFRSAIITAHLDLSMRTEGELIRPPSSGKSELRPDCFPRHGVAESLGLDLYDGADFASLVHLLSAFCSGLPSHARLISLGLGGDRFSSLSFLESESEKMTGWKACPTYSQITMVDKNQSARQAHRRYLPIAVIGTFIGNLL